MCVFLYITTQPSPICLKIKISVQICVVVSGKNVKKIHRHATKNNDEANCVSSKPGSAF